MFLIADAKLFFIVKYKTLVSKLKKTQKITWWSAASIKCIPSDHKVYLYTGVPHFGNWQIPNHLPFIYIKGFHTLEIGKFPTISQLFRSSSPTISQLKLHGSHSFSERAIPNFSIFFQNVWFISLVINQDICLWSPQPCCTNLTNSQLNLGWE